VRPQPAPELRLLLLAPILFAFTLTTVDPDLWGMLTFGRDWAARAGLAAGGTFATGEGPVGGLAGGLAGALGLVTTDPYSYTAGDFPWIQHEWAIGPIFYLIYSVAGRVGLTLLKLAIELGILLVLLREAARQEVPGLGRWVLFIVALPAISLHLLTVRAGLFTALFVALTCAVLLRARSQPRFLYALAPLVAIWVNLHGGVIAGLSLAGLWWLATLLLDPPGNRMRWARQTLPALGLSLFALLMNPYGIRLPLLLAGAGFMPRPMITEWQSVLTSPVIFLVFVSWFGLCLIGWLASTRPRRPAEALVCIAAAAQAFLHLRHVSIAAIVCFAFSAGHISSGLARLRDLAVERWPAAARRLGRTGSDPTPPPKYLRAVAAGLAIAIILASLSNIPFWVVSPIEFPYAAVATLRAAEFSGNLLVDFNWGEFVINRMSPGVRVSFDGRFETAYPPEIAAAHWAFYLGDPAGDALLERFHTDGILLAPGWPACARLRENPAWEVAYEDAVAVIFLPAARLPTESKPAAAMPATPKPAPSLSAARVPSAPSHSLTPAEPGIITWIPEYSLWGGPTLRVPLLPARPYEPDGWRAPEERSSRGSSAIR
jgi:hypothetical protein